MSDTEMRALEAAYGNSRNDALRKDGHLRAAEQALRSAAAVLLRQADAMRVMREDNAAGPQGEASG